MSSIAASAPTSSVIAYSGSSYADHLVGPVEDLGAVLLRYADELGDGLEREFAGDLGDEVEAAVVRRAGQRGLDDRAGAVAQGRPPGRGSPAG